MKNNALSVNLIRLRNTKGLNQSEVAEMVGISRIAYSSIENGKSEPRVNTLTKIAEVFNVSIQDLLNPVVQLKSLRFRTLKQLSQKEKNRREQIIIDFSSWLRDYNELEDLLNIKKVNIIDKITGDNPRDYAEKTRRRLELKTREPIFNIFSILSLRAGVKIYLKNAELTSFFGFSVNFEDGGPAIFVNTYDSISLERQILTAAHEFGHLLMHKSSYKNNKEIESKKEEDEANAFAGYFLMPYNDFIHEWNNNSGLHWFDNILITKRRFRVSYRAIIQRLNEMKIVKDTSYLWRQFYIEYEKRYSKKLINHLEPEALKSLIESSGKEEPEKLDKIDFIKDHLIILVKQAYEKELISFNRAAEILRLNNEEMRELLNSWEMTKEWNIESGNK